MDFDDLDDLEKEADGEEDVAGQSKETEVIEEKDEYTTQERTEREWAKSVTSWQFVSMDHLAEHALEEAPGMRYGIKFPHSIELLSSFAYGPNWLTRAFHTAGTLPKNNRVTAITSKKKFFEGGAGVKAYITVEYEKPAPGLHKKLFLKMPFPYEGSSKSDRMQISVNQQPQDLQEVDAYRLLEGRLPFPIPKYYFADVSNQSTNFILITECILFADRKKKVEDLAPNEVEPSYRKFFDDIQFKDPLEYYMVMSKQNATMAGWYKTGKLGDPVELDKYFPDVTKAGCPGPLSANEFKVKLGQGEDFIKDKAKILFPKDLITSKRMKEWKEVLNIYNAYRTEIHYSQNVLEDYSAIHHINMNADNSWFWRDENKKLHVGALDWGGLSRDNIARKLWWSYYGGELHMLENHLDTLLQLFIDTYAQEGGPKLDIEILRKHFFMGALDQAIGLLGSVPFIYRTIKKDEWKTVKDVHDERIGEEYLTKMYIRGFLLTFQLIFSFKLPKLLDDVVSELHTAGVAKKDLVKL